MDILDIAIAGKLAKGKGGGSSDQKSQIQIQIVCDINELHDSVESLNENYPGEDFYGEKRFAYDEVGNLCLYQSNGETWAYLTKVDSNTIYLDMNNMNLYYYYVEDCFFEEISRQPEEKHLYLHTAEMRVRVEFTGASYGFYITLNFLTTDPIFDDVEQIKDYLRDGTTLMVSSSGFTHEEVKYNPIDIVLDGSSLAINCDNGSTKYIKECTLERTATKQIF